MQCYRTDASSQVPPEEYRDREARLKRRSGLLEHGYNPPYTMKRTFAALAALVIVSLNAPLSAQQTAGATKPAGFNVFEASIADMQAAMKDGRTTSHQIVQQYLT